jgi:DNA-binding CsgD family transcriptional regulator
LPITEPIWKKKVARQGEKLKSANRDLQRQLTRLEKIRGSLQEKSDQLKEANTALRYLLKQREKDEIKIEERIRNNVHATVLPYLNALKNTPLTENQKEYAELIGNNIYELLKPFSQHLTSKQVGLTNVELRVADLVKNGKRNKEIAHLLCIATKTVEFHRENIRKKLGIRNRKVNLRTYLTTL